MPQHRLLLDSLLQEHFPGWNPSINHVLCCFFYFSLRSHARERGALLRDHHVRPAGVPDLLAAGGDGLLLQEDL